MLRAIPTDRIQGKEMKIDLTAPQMSAAFKRAFLGGSIAAAAAIIAWANTKPEYAVAAGIGGAFLTRFLAEGGFDTNRAASGDIREGDVGIHN